MKIAPKQYAILLYEMTHDKKGVELAKAMQSFVQLLIKNRATAQLARIERMYRDYYNAQECVVDMEVVTANVVPKKLTNEIKDVVAGLQPAQRNLKVATTVEIAERIDPAVLGGARIRVGDYMIDDTLKAKLMKLKLNLTSTKI